MTVAWVFPGQGSQQSGMADAVLSLPGAAKRFALASERLGRDLLAICSTSETGEGLQNLHDTRNTQPALFVVESLLVDALQSQGRQPELVAGHSLGELVALYAAGVFDADTGLALMQCRSELMATAGGGAMTAVIGFDPQQLHELVATTEGVVVANDNSEAQVVLSGAPEAVAAVSRVLRCKRAIPLAVSGAFHSPFMAEAAARFAEELERVPFREATVPVVSNSDPTPERDPDILKSRLKWQMTSGVRWRETMKCLEQEGILTAVEIGPGNVLSGLIKRGCPGVETAQVGSAADLEL
jgi:[acyl-carrier-protein] S-malonyltransferase